MEKPGLFPEPQLSGEAVCICGQSGVLGNAGVSRLPSLLHAL